MSAVIEVNSYPAVAAFGQDLLVAFGAASGDGDAGAGGGQPEGEGASESLVPSGDDGGTSGQIEWIVVHAGTTIDLRLAGSLSLSRASATCSRS